MRSSHSSTCDFLDCFPHVLAYSIVCTVCVILGGGGGGRTIEVLFFFAAAVLPLPTAIQILVMTKQMVLGLMKSDFPA